MDSQLPHIKHDSPYSHGLTNLPSTPPLIHLKRNTRGFTLPEMLLTALILSYSLSMVLAAFTNSVALNQSSRSLATAVTHAQYVLEEIRNTSFNNIAPAIANGSWTWNTATVTARGLTALNNEAITTTSSGANPLDVSVTVSWNEIKGANHSRTFKTTFSG